MRSYKALLKAIEKKVNPIDMPIVIYTGDSSFTCKGVEYPIDRLEEISSKLNTPRNVPGVLEVDIRD